MPRPSEPTDRGRRALGEQGESVAARFLTRRGLEILGRNLRTRWGEIDLIARTGGTLVFVEVKTRQGESGDPPQAAVGPRKQARLGRLAQGYLARHPGPERACRFDVVAVTFEGETVRRVDHFPGAFVLATWPG